MRFIFTALLLGILALNISACRKIPLSEYETSCCESCCAPDTRDPKSLPPAALKDKAEKGDAGAQLGLGNFYGRQFTSCAPAVSAEQWEKTRTVAICTTYKDASQAAMWYRKAADQGNSLAQYKLAALYVHGAGVKQDYTEAYFWFTLSRKVEVKPGLLDKDIKAIVHNFSKDRDLEVVVQKLTPEQKATVEKRVMDWLKVHTASVQSSNCTSNELALDLCGGSYLIPSHPRTTEP